jgi:uncharacterized repeat protein (TIGR02543 family)
MSRRFPRSVVGALAIALAFGNVSLVGSAAQATETYTNVSTGTSQTFADGTTATASFANFGAYVSGGFNGVATYGYKITADDNSSVTITFSSSKAGWTGISDLKLAYGWVNEGDPSQISTNVAPGGLDLTDTSILTASTNTCTPNAACPGGPVSYTSTGLIQAPASSAGNSYMGTLTLHFATPITSITVLGPADRPAPAGSYGAGLNGIGFSIPVVTFAATFNSNGGSGTMANQSAGVPTNLATNTFTRTGYTFAGWNTEEDGSGTPYADGASFDFSGDTPLYAQWTRDSSGPRIVTFDSNGGTGTMAEVTSGTAGPLPTNTLTRDGYTFAGWNTLEDGTGTQYADGATFNFGSDETLFAQWIENRTVTFDPNGGIGTMPDQSIGGTAPLAENTLTREGYTFAGWNTQEDGTGTQYADGATFDFGSDETLFAQWIENHTVTFDPNGGIGTMPDQSIGGTAPLAENTLTREGYTFAGWNTEQDGSGTDYADGADFDFSSDQTLFAQWTSDAASSGAGAPSITDLVNTGLSLVGPAGTAGIILAIGAPFFLLSSRFRRVREYGAIVLHKSSHVTISTPATLFDRLRRKKD